MIECTVPKSISNHFRHYATAWECIDYLTKRFDKLHQSEQARTEGRVGEKGETPHGRDDEAAAATGPGTKTMDHHRTDGGSLVTPASSSRDDQKVELNLVKPLPPLPSVASTTPPKRTQRHANESRENGQVVVDRDDNNRERRVHERIDDPAHGADTSTDKTTAIATASASTDAAAPHHARNTPLKGERSGRESTGKVGARTEVGKGEDGGEKRLSHESSKPTEPASSPDEAEATRDQGNQPTTSMSAQSVPRDTQKTPARETHHSRQKTLGMRRVTTSVIQMHPQSRPTSPRAGGGEGARRGCSRHPESARGVRATTTLRRVD